MPSPRHLVLIACEVSDPRDQQRLARYLEERMTCVQNCLYEGWMTRREAEHTAQAAALLIDGADSLRLYVLPRGAVSACRAWGFPPAPCPDGALIL